MNRFETQRDAKEFLVGEVVREAERQGQPLTDIERKMLYFSETDWTLPDMDEIGETFDRECNTPKYERKIAKLARAAHKQAGTDKLEWSEAISRLEEGDHYILVMMRQAGVRRSDSITWQGVVAVLLVFIVGVAGREVFGGSALFWTAISLPAIWFASRLGTRKPKNV